MKSTINFSLILLSVTLFFACNPSQNTTQTDTASVADSLQLEKLANAEKPRNIIFILSDDHRYDFMGFTGKLPWLETPAMDRLAKEGAYFPNAFVTTSLCSPSRASILTGLYSHTHTIVDNQAPDPGNLIYFPQYLQKAGYETAFFGKWHMGDDSDEPKPGFDHWESFKGQGKYYGATLNINGERTTYPDSVNTTDLLTQHVLEWLANRKSDKPFFVYLSHKAVHARFEPSKRHLGDYKDVELILPPSINTSQSTVQGTKNDSTQTPYQTDEYYGKGRVPDWQKMQRESWHGIDYMYHGEMDFDTFYRRYCETLKGVDESIAATLKYLEENNLDQSTMMIYMGDNGFAFGEHGLIDKRQFYEESVKVPFLVRCPEIFSGGETNEKMVQNVDIAPTFLALAGLQKPEYMVGESIIPLLKGEEVAWRDKIFYEYYWEYDFPQTPTMHGVRTDRYKYIRYHGIWDTNEFYDLQEDPNEMNNLIASPEHQEKIKELAGEIYDWLESTGGMQIPLKRTIKHRWGDHRNKEVY